MDPRDDAGHPLEPHGAPDDRPGRPESGEDGERSLIRWMLSLSPAQRLEVLQRHVDAVESLRTGA
jgi:hypothetical protein